MQVNMKGLINQLDDLRERLNKLFDKLEKLDDLDQEEIAIEDVEQYFQNDDSFNLSIALDILEQADKLDKALEIIKEKQVDIHDFKFVCYKLSWDYTDYSRAGLEYKKMIALKHLTQEEFDLLKEVLLCD